MDRQYNSSGMFGLFHLSNMKNKKLKFAMVDYNEKDLKDAESKNVHCIHLPKQGDQCQGIYWLAELLTDTIPRRYFS